MPLPSTRVVHPRWSAHHAPVTEDAMNAVVVITYGGTEPTWSSGGHESEGEAVTTYAGEARVVYDPVQGRDTESADQDVTVRRVTVSLPRTADDQEVGARVLVLSVDDNAPSWLTGTVLTVASLGRSSYAWEQLLECADDLANQPAEETP